MKTNYFSKVENKYVFNVSLIFWHLFIALSTIAIIISVLVFLWSIIPPTERKVEKQQYPEKTQYPEPVEVLLSELKLEEIKQEETPPPLAQVQTTVAKTDQKVVEDTQGIDDYETSLKSLKILIPPSKYNWEGSGYWYYPYGENYWKYYKHEMYRRRIVTESGLEDKLKLSYKTTDAKTYPEKKKILDGFIAVIKLLPEEKRIVSLQYLLNNSSNNLSQSINICQSIASIIPKMADEKSTLYINQLAVFAKNNPNDGSPFIDYVSTIIDKFDILQRNKILDGLINSYYYFFNQNLPKLTEATSLMIPMLGEIKGEYHPKALK
ncbi:MAG: hypothetical protein U1C46_07785, partial [Bacteroidales bacterium]|nr:hypothetical protein [Bacteroidales bacterium]